MLQPPPGECTSHYLLLGLFLLTLISPPPCLLQRVAFFLPTPVVSVRALSLHPRARARLSGKKRRRCSSGARPRRHLVHSRLAHRAGVRCLRVHGRCRPGRGTHSRRRVRADEGSVLKLRCAPRIKDFEAARKKALAVGAKKFFLEVRARVQIVEAKDLQSRTSL